MEDKELNIEISDKDCVGYSEVYWEFFQCTNCNDDSLINSYKFCPNCGFKLKWNLIKSFSHREKVIINTGKLKGVEADFYDFDRKNKKVTVRIDKNELTFNYNDIIRENN